MAQCLSDAEIDALARGLLTKQRATAAAAHLIECSACGERLDRVKMTLSAISMHRAPTQVEVTSAMEITRGSTGVESHWSDNNLNVPVATPGDTAISNVSIADFLIGLSQSGLLPQVEMDKLRRKSQDDPTSTVAALVEWLVQEHKLTTYQAEILARGQQGGLVIGNYVILEKLGQGGMGTVFLARHRRMNRLVALKVLPQSLSSIPEAILRFQREVEAAARLQHPNIAAAFDADEASGVHFLVMEYVDGPTLSSYVKQRGALPLSPAVRLMVQAASGLAAAHAQGVVHRDIKPGNMMISRQGVLKVLDMGLAQMRGQDANIELTSDVTQTGRVMGTVDYMAPEQARDAKNVDLRADIYSLGCTLFFLTTGRTPAPGSSAAEKLLWHQSAKPPVLSSIVPESTPKLDAALAKMMAKEADARQSSMLEVVSDLEACLAELPGDTNVTLDGIAVAGDHHGATLGGSRATHATLHGGMGDTLMTRQRQKRSGAGAPAAGGKRTWWLAAAGLAAAALLAVFAVPMAMGRRTASAAKDDHNLAVPTRVAAAVPIPAPVVKAPSPHAPYEKLLRWVFQNHGRATAVSGGGEQLQLTAMTDLPAQPVEILAIKLDGTGVRDADLATLAQAPGLRELSLADTKITDSGLEHLVPLKQLSQLSLAKTGVTSGGLATLARLAELTELNLERTPLSNQGMARILGLAKLERLYLSDTEVSDAGIEQLQGLKSLRHLAVHGTSLSDQGHAALKTANPQLDIAWDGADVERSVALKLLGKGATLAVIDRAGRRHDGIKTIESLPPGRITIKDINLGTGDFGDDDLKQLSVLSEVEFLSLAGTSTTSAGLAHLQGMATLKSVDLGTLRFAPTAVESLRKALPSAQVLVREPADVEVALAVLGAGGRVSVFTERNQLLPDIKDQRQLPAGQFTLRAINLDDVAAIDDGALARLGELPQLQSLFLTNTSVTDAACRQLAGCKSLAELGLSGTRVTGEGLAALTTLPKLSRLYLASLELGELGARRLGEFAGLTHLSLRGVKLNDDDLAALKRLDRLEWLDVSQTQLSDASIVHLAELKSLRELNVSNTSVTDAGREEVANALTVARVVGDAPNAQRLAARWLVERSATVTLEDGKLTSVKALPRGAVRILAIDAGALEKLKRDELKEQLAGCKDLVSLNLSGTKLVEADLAVLKAMPALREVRLANLPLSDRLLEQLAAQKDLEVIDLSGTFVTGQGLKHLTAAAGLKQLLLANARISDLHFASLTNFPQLEVLDVSAAPNMTDAGAETLAKMNTLRVLRLRAAKITDAGLEKLAALTNLEELDVEGAKVTDAGVGKLAPLTKLRSLGLGNTQVTDGVAGTLGQMKTLQQVILTRTKIAPETIQQLRTELKGASIAAPAFTPRDNNFNGGGFGQQPQGRGP